MEKINKKLMEAVESNDIETVKQLIEQGASVNMRDKDGKTPLYGACFLGHLEIVKYLVEQGADVNARNSSDDTPLNIARNHSNTEMIKYFKLKTNEELKETIKSRLSGAQIFEYPSYEQMMEYDYNLLRWDECFLYTVENIYLNPGENNKKIYMLSKKYCTSVIASSIVVANEVFEELKDICWFVVFEQVLITRDVMFTEIANSYYGDNRPNRVYKKTLDQEVNNEK